MKTYSEILVIKTGEHQYGGSTEVRTILSDIDPPMSWPILAFPFSFFPHKPGKGKRTRIIGIRFDFISQTDTLS